MLIFTIIQLIVLKIIQNELNDILFNSIIGDNYNLTSIYNYNYDNIKIKHQSKHNTSNKIICIFGVLANKNGIKIEKEMLNWLLPEYNIYCVYQKYPGHLYEYPDLRFAQWLLQTFNKTILLYLHTKGAFNINIYQIYIRKLWKNEFKHPKNKIYIQSILTNKTDISLPFRKDRTTWFNGMFISKRAFDLIPQIPLSTNRYFYEGGLFNGINIRIKGIIDDNQSADKIFNAIYQSLSLQKNNKIFLIILEFILFGFIIIIKLYINNVFTKFKFKKKIIP